MSESTPRIEDLRSRAAWPRYIGLAAGAILAATVAVGLFIFFIADRPSDFRMKAFPPKLSKDIVAVVDGYERRESDGTIVKYYIKADRATTYTDNHQELENVYLEIYDDTGEKFDKITASKGVYVPSADRNFTAYLAGNVDILTRDVLNVRTEQVTYRKETDTAEAEEKVEFSREEFKGSAVGAVVHVKNQRLELLDQFEFSGVAGSRQGELARNKIESFKGSSARAEIDQLGGTVRLIDRVDIRVAPMENNESASQPAQIRAANAVAYLVEKEVSKVELTEDVALEQFATKNAQRWVKTKSERGTAFLEGGIERYELSGDAEIRTGIGQQKPTVIKAGIASYEKKADRFDLREAVSIVTEEGDRPTTLKASSATYEQGKGKVLLAGSVEVSTASETLTASSVSADLDQNRKLRWANAKGEAVLVQRTPERTVEASGAELVASFDADQNLQKADATGKPKGVVVPVSASEYSRVTLLPAKAIRTSFGPGGFINSMDTEGRTTIELTAPSSSPDAADKRLTADTVKTFFSGDGRNLSRAEATGSAELQIVPQQALEGNFRTTVTAPGFNCEFFPVGNNARSCTAGPKTKTLREPMVKGPARGDQTLFADRLTAAFSGRNQDLEALEAFGAAKFTEADRNGTSTRITFNAGTGIVSLREGRPTVWDSRGRALADEIDLDTRQNKSALRGNVSATYYNQRQLNGATPFASANAPVYVTSNAADFAYADERAVFSGNARAWQGNNFLKGDTVEIQQKQKRVVVSGNVQTMFFDAKSKIGGKDSSVPVFGSSQKMTYDAASRRAVYETAVEIRQGSDRIAGQQVTAVLNEKNELVEALADGDVIMTQPGRRASGEFAQYKVADEVVVLRGSPARVEDSVNGSSEGAEVTVFLRDRRVIGDGRSKTNSSGRIRTVYKVNKNQ